MEIDETKLKLDGEWWLTGSTVKMPGRLVFDNVNGGSLTISGNFLIPHEIYSFRNRERFTILGEYEGGKKITLIAYHQSKHNDNIHFQDNQKINNVFSELVFSIQFVILGKNYELISDIAFESIFVQYRNLCKYFRISDFDTLSTTESESKFYGSRLKPLECKVNALTIRVLYGSIFRDREKNKSQEGIYVQFQYNDAKSLDEFLKTATAFLELFDFISGGDIQTYSILVAIANSSLGETVDILWHSPLFKRNRSSKLQISRNIFQGIKEEFNNIISAWFSFKSHYPVIYDFWFATIFNKDLYLSNEFLMITVAIEAYHAIAWKELSQKSFENKTFVNRVKNVIEEAIENNPETKDDIQRISILISNWKHPYLAQRMEELCDYYWEILSILLPKIGSKKCFISKVVKYRNALSHGNLIPEEEEGFHEFFLICQHVKMVLYLCILSVLKFSNERIKTLTRLESISQSREARLKTTLDFLDPDVTTILNCVKESNLPCKFPKSLNNNPTLVLKIVEDVQNYLRKQFDKLGLSQDEMECYKYNFFNHGKINKGVLIAELTCIHKRNFRDMNENVGGTVISIWAGCVSAAKAVLNDGSDRSPNFHSRSDIFEGLGKLAADNPSFGKGIEVGILWAHQNNQHDINFVEAGTYSSIRKYENTYFQMKRNSISI